MKASILSSYPWKTWQGEFFSKFSSIMTLISKILTFDLDINILDLFLFTESIFLQFIID